MPHYADGTLAQVGDLVAGKPYNTKHEVIGQVMQVTPGESCNLIVAFAETLELTQDEALALSKAGIYEPKTLGVSGGKYFLIRGRYDYGETRAFRKVSAVAESVTA